MAGGQIKLGIFGNVEDQEALLKLAKDAIRKQFFKVVGIEEKEVVSRQGGVLSGIPRYAGQHTGRRLKPSDRP